MKYVTRCGVAALWWWALLSAPHQAWALQSVSGHDAAVVKVSSRDLNRIALPSKVLKAYTSKPIDVRVEGHDVYVKVPATVTGPIELYLHTEDETYTLMLVPVPIPAETVVIKAGVGARPSLEGEPYVRQIKSLLRAIASGMVPKGYDAIPIAESKEECTVGARSGMGQMQGAESTAPERTESVREERKRSGNAADDRSWTGSQCSLTPVRRHVGSRLSVTEYQLSNPGPAPRAYDEASFDRPGTRAVAIERQPLDTGGATRLFRVEEVVP